MIIDRVTRSAAATERLAGAIAVCTRPPLVLLLDGDLGAGKTTFARGFVGALPGSESVVVQSPTFALARRYATTPPVHHLDLYRLDDAAGLEELGLIDTLSDPTAYALVEWPRDLALPGLAVARVIIREEARGRRVRVDLPDDVIVDRARLESAARAR